MGVGITVAVRASGKKDRQLFYYRLPEYMRREEKLRWLAERRSLCGVEWQALTPDSRNTWNVPKNAADFASYLPLGIKERKAVRRLEPQAIFKLYSLGVVTARDDAVYDFHRNALIERVGRLIVVRVSVETARLVSRLAANVTLP